MTFYSLLLLIVIPLTSFADHAVKDARHASPVGPCENFWDYVCNRQTVLDVSDQRDVVAAVQKRITQFEESELTRFPAYVKSRLALFEEEPWLKKTPDMARKRYMELFEEEGTEAFLDRFMMKVARNSGYPAGGYPPWDMELDGISQHLFRLVPNSQEKSKRWPKNFYSGRPFGEKELVALRAMLADGLDKTAGEEARGWVKLNLSLIISGYERGFRDHWFDKARKETGFEKRAREALSPESSRSGELWKQVKDSSDELLARWNLPILSDDTRAAVFRHPPDDFYNLRHHLESGSANFQEKEGKLNVELASHLGIRNPDTLATLLAHEFGHAVVHGNTHGREPYALPGSNSYRNFFKEVTDCLARPGATGARKDQLEETFADWFAAELIAWQAERKTFSSRDEERKAAMGIVFDCSSLEKYDEKDTHLRSDVRINRIFMAHPYFRRLFGCERDPKRRYCGRTF